MTIDQGGLHLSFNAEVNGVAGIMVLDTGASICAFDLQQVPSHSKQENEKTYTAVGVSQSIEAKESSGNVLLIDGLKVEDFQAMFVDLTEVNQQYQAKGLPAIIGLFGSDLLEKYRAEINYETMTLTLKV